ncbi:MAG: CTP synthase [Clostridia bacterium]|nr:CTP synthase [Clostridia bacterium]
MTEDLWAWILAACGVIAAVGAATTYIAKVIKPARDLIKRIDSQDKKLDNDNKRLTELEGGSRECCKALLALLDHEITGNSIEKIKMARDDMNRYLIER